MSFVSTGNKTVGSDGPAITTPPIVGENNGVSSGAAVASVTDAAEQMAEQAVELLFGELPEPSGLVKAAVAAAQAAAVAAGISDNLLRPGSAPAHSSVVVAGASGGFPASLSSASTNLSCGMNNTRWPTSAAFTPGAAARWVFSTPGAPAGSHSRSAPRTPDRPTPGRPYDRCLAGS